MKKSIVILAIVSIPVIAMAQWAIETKDNEVSSINDVVAAYTETIVTQRATYGQLLTEYQALGVEKAELQARIAEIDAKRAWISGPAQTFFTENCPKLLPEEQQE